MNADGICGRQRKSATPTMAHMFFLEMPLSQTAKIFNSALRTLFVFIKIVCNQNPIRVYPLLSA